MAEKVGLEAVLQMGDFNHNLSIYLKGLDKINRETVKTATSSSKAMGGVGDFFRGVAQIATGIGLADALRATGGAIDYVARQAIKAASTFQGLRIQMEGLIAGSLRNADANLTVADSLDKAIPLTKDLLSWIRQTAVTTPFTVETLSTMTAMNLGMGRSVEEAKALSMAVGNMTAGLGLGGTEAERITRALNQMASKGKVTGQDLLQLSDASVPLQLVWANLGKQFNVTAQAAREMASSGAISANDFITAFADVANNQFPGAMERMAGTLEGVTSNIKDFISTVIGIDVLGPAIEKFTADAKTALDRLMEPDAQGMARAIGEMLSAGYDEVAAFTSEAFGYGQNIAIQLANGILDGAAAVLDALANIGNLIAYWLAPGSPPRILPDLPSWGADAMGEYMAGWGKADVGVFSEMSGVIEKALRDTMPKDDKAGQVSLIDRVFGARSAAAAAIEEMRRFGDVSDASLQRVFDAAGMVNPRMQAYVRTLFQLEGVNAKVAAAQDELTKAQEAYDAALKAADDRIDAVTEAEQRLADQVKISQLQLILNDPGATALEKERARLKIEKIRADEAKRNVIVEKKGAVDAAKVKLDAAKSEQDRLEAQADAQKAVLGVQSEQNKLLGEQLKLIEDIAKAAAASAKAGGAGKTPTPAGGGRLNLAVPELAGGEDLAESFKQKFLAKIDEMLSPLKTKFSGVQTAWEPTVNWITGIWTGTIQPAWNGFKNWWETDFGPFLSEIWSILSTEGSEAINTVVDDILGRFIPDFQEAGRIVGEIFGPPIQDAWTWIKENIPPAIQTVGDFINNTLLPAFLDVSNFVRDEVIVKLGQLRDFLNVDVANATQALSDIWKGTLQPALEGVWAWMQDPLFPFLESLADLISATVEKSVKDMAATWEGTLKPALETVWKFFNEHILPILKDVWKEISENLKPILEKLEGFLAGTFAITLGIISGAFEGISRALQSATEWLGKLADGVRGMPSPPPLFTPGSPTPFEMGLRGINDAMRELAMLSGPTMRSAMANQATHSSVSTYSYAPVHNFNLSVATRETGQNVVANFATMKALAGAP